MTKKITKAIIIERKHAYKMVCRFRKKAEEAKDDFFFHEMNEQAKQMEEVAKKDGYELLTTEEWYEQRGEKVLS